MTWIEMLIQTVVIIFVVVAWSEVSEHIRFQKLERELIEALWERIEKRCL